MEKYLLVLQLTINLKLYICNVEYSKQNNEKNRYYIATHGKKYRNEHY